MNRIRIFVFCLHCLCLALEAQTVVSYERPQQKELRKSVDVVLNKTSCLDADMSGRLDAMGVIQRDINNFTCDQWKEYNALMDADEISSWEKEGTLYFYRKAMDKVLKELRRTKIRHGQVVLWNLYNMGYIVKTPSQTFAVDLVHKHIEDFAPYLDFALITHKHKDHGSQREFEAYAAAGLKVYAGYVPSSMPQDLSWTYVEDGDFFSVGNVTVRAKRVDHYYHGEGLKMVTSYEIDCGDDTGNAVVFHVGDSCNYAQLESEAPVDIFIFHTAVKLDIQRALDKIRPMWAVFSHAWELGHSVEKYRWTIDDLVIRSGKVEGFPVERILLPCWGEKLTYTKDTGIRSGNPRRPSGQPHQNRRQL